MNLTLHCGANVVDRHDVLEIPTPPPTQTHYPIAHRRIILEAERQLDYQGYKIATQAHSLSHEGQRYFGLLELENEATDHALVVGIRNSHDKSFAAGLVMGAGVFVCDNLSFSGEIKLARKHTRFVDRDFPKVTHRAIAKLRQFGQEQHNQIERFKSHELTEDRARSLIIEGLKRGCFPNQSIQKIVREWEEPSHEEFAEPTVWRLFNAVTEVAKDWSLSQKSKRTQLLTALCNGETSISV